MSHDATVIISSTEDSRFRGAFHFVLPKGITASEA
jgi:hypothetical protein